MSTATLGEKKLKTLLKSAFAEALEEQRALVQDIVEDAIEDIALSRAIDEGLRSKPASRAAINKILEGK
jgi:outer membrane protein TolC